MLNAIHPRLPMRNKAATSNYYAQQLGFKVIADYGNYLMVQRDDIEIHLFEFKELDPLQNYSGVYIRTDNIDELYQSLLDNHTTIHPNGPLQVKPWGQKEFALLDPDHNLLTFGESV